jgi:beta-lactam-binding protein with PASTA domain/tRNA A-37 threonylcarbamoyl transferase component Bud32
MVGRLLDGRYQVRARIARGGMATVYLATDLRLERRVAIKVMHGHLADDAAFRDRFIQEARSAARLAHPNVVNVFDQGQDSDMAYLVMEYLQGITLRDLLKEYGKLTPEQTMDIMEAVLAGLAAAHKAGIVHRDLKPENVLLADDGRIKIGDFGLARAATANTATGQALLGTIAYLSPELVTRGIADTRSDIYAVGIMMFEMLVGDQPFKGDQPVQIAYQHANETVPAPSTRNPGIPVALDELVLWATARDPEQRPRDARALLDQLFETQNLIREGLGGVSTATQRTMVLPAAGSPTTTVHESGETQVLSRARRTGPVALESASQLSAAVHRRRRRGFWLFGLVLMLAAVAGGTGWYFGSGPGAHVGVPSVAGLSVGDATAELAAAGFTVGGQDQVFDYRTDKDLVSSTDPAPGDSVLRDTPITLHVSKGPEPLPVPAVVGTPEAEARAALADARFQVADDVQREFTEDAADGEVLRVLDGRGKAIKKGALYPDHATLSLVLSAGPVPNVVGMTVAQATAALEKVDLKLAEGDASYDNSGDSEMGDILSVDKATDKDGDDRPFRPGDTVTVHVSLGMDLVVVPNVVGLSWSEARPLLDEAGFALAYNTAADDLPSVVVTATDPVGGDSALRGSTVSVAF